MVWLLDSSVLSALTDQAHEQHRTASTWAAQAGSFAVCPITEGAMIRYHIRRGSAPNTARQLVRAVEALESCEFWPDSLPYSSVALGHVLGHRQVTDAYLAALARSRPGSRLATLDRGLASALPAVAVLLTDA